MIYILYIDTEYNINNLTYGSDLERCEEFTGTGCNKISALYRLGYKRVKGSWIQGIHRNYIKMQNWHPQISGCLFCIH